ncbi:Ger(x)C family spore germination protein [Psychrobacillus vulpis]|uniref:Ger(X)C family spore germination protein n=1 Tax=Psychrobacillus vulpis TaxID=2325572 RepID=A0A544TQZ9_9BACI|nr:Ger(x)C family spore germination protein [Psychrobacillus vulpis]TQR19887.1 Ger(x)C family spore germination protein [Psychrobacillus vulpis]
MKRIKMIILFILVTFISGCWDVTEPERMLYIYGVGVDYKDNKYEVYAQIVNFVNIAKSEQPNLESNQVEVGHGSGKTIDDAIFSLYRSMDLKLFWGHFSYLIFSEEVLKNGNANPVINAFIRYRETRYQTWVYTTSDPIKDVLLLTPIFNKAMTLSKISDPENSYKQDSLIEPIDLRELIIMLNEPSYEVKIPLITIKENWETEKELDKAASILGIGVISPTDFKGFIKGDKIRGLQWMTEETVRSELTFKIDSHEESYMTVILDNLDVKVKPIVTSDNVNFDIDVRLNVLVSEFQGKITPDEIRKGVIKQVKKEIEDTYKEGLKNDIDIYRLSEYVYRQKVETWKKQQTDGKIRLSDDSIRDLNVVVGKIYSGRKSFEETIK